MLSDVDDRIQNDPASRVMMSGQKEQFLTMFFNEAKVSVKERSRLYVRRLGFCNSRILHRLTSDPDNGNLPKLMQLNED
jgi:hypothetical protein